MTGAVVETPQLRDGEEVLLRVADLVVEHHAPGGGTVYAVSGVSFDLRQGETLGLVGESGCGKSSTGRAIVADPPPTSGSVRFDGEELSGLDRRSLRRARAKLQVIFQDPRSSLNPRRSIANIVNEGPTIWHDGGGDEDRIDEMLAAVGLDPEVTRERKPRDLSGGQCQRVAIARALMLEPKLLICDEPVSALDVSVQAQIINLLEETKERYELALLFIAHDLSVVKNISDRVAVMYMGKLCELAPTEELYNRPVHPYTQALLRSVPVPDPTVPIEPVVLEGDMPSPLEAPRGCPFRSRCHLATERCGVEAPPMREIAAGHYVACHEATIPAG